MAKRKASALASVATETLPPLPPPKRPTRRKTNPTLINPDVNNDVLDGPQALRASPDAEEKSERFTIENVDDNAQIKEEENGLSLVGGDSDSSLSDAPEIESPTKAKTKINGTAKSKVFKIEMATKVDTTPARTPMPPKKEPQNLDPEADGEEVADEAEIQAASQRPPAVNSDYLPLPWKGRLGYACLNTYLRFSNPPVFASRTCRIASILEYRHPLKDPSQPAHPTKNRPDKDQPASIERGQAYVEGLGVANARDCIKMLRWNDRYGIKFMRLSSEMFPFASHDEYGYRLAPFASEVLGEVGKVAGELGHRLTTHPGQFTQLGSPRNSVIKNAIRDLEYHAELLSLLKLPPQQDRDAVMILHLGGAFGDKAATLDRFRENYAALPQGIKNRLVLENDDVSWSVHELLPLCEELNIPFVLDFHHHNIVFDAEQIREGSKDIMDLYPRILATWSRKNIRPKMHYSEPTPPAITGHQRRKHNPRVAGLPPCPDTMDLMIEAKDKEQAVFELMKTFKLPGHNSLSTIVPHVRRDDNKPIKLAKAKFPKKKAKKTKTEDGEDEDTEPAEMEFVQEVIPEDDVGMGGSEGRVYWPPGMEDWLRPVKRVIKKKEPGEEKLTPAAKRQAAAKAAKAAEELEAEVKDEADGLTDTSVVTPTPSSSKKATPAKKTAAKQGATDAVPAANGRAVNGKKKSTPKKATPKKAAKEATPAITSEEDEGLETSESEEIPEEKLLTKKRASRPVAAPRRQSSGRARKAVVYTEDRGESG